MMSSMLRLGRVRSLSAVACCVVLTTCRPLWGCAVCFGDKDDPLIRGASSGILVMLIITYGVLLGMGGVFASWIVRSRKVASTRQGSPEA